MESYIMGLIVALIGVGVVHYLKLGEALEEPLMAFVVDSREKFQKWKYKNYATAALGLFMIFLIYLAVNDITICMRSPECIGGSASATAYNFTTVTPLVRMGR